MRCFAVALVLCLLPGNESGAAPVTFPLEAQLEWSHTSPATVGLDEAALRALDVEIGQGRYALVDHLLIVRCGARAFERQYAHDYSSIYRAQARERGPLNAHLTGPYNYFDVRWHPYLQNTDLHTLQSATKSLTSVIYGVAITRGDFKASLNTPVLHYFRSSAVRNVDDRKRRMTLRNILTMSTGLDWNEDLALDDPANPAIQMEASDDWVQYVIDRPMVEEPGTVFTYSSGASELLAFIFRAETGQDLERYAERYLFAPLGIKKHYWKRTPQNLVDTEGGLYLRAEDLAKIGQLYLNRGLWRGHVLVSSDWVAESLEPRFDGGAGWRYGYQWWLRPHGAAGTLAFAARGFGGQLLLVDPAARLIVVMNGWNIVEDVSGARDAIDALLATVRAPTCPAH
jgi:CubicO group peptidase (beta-lactamase class C family)